MKRFPAFIVMLLTFCSAAKAQYESIRSPLSQEDKDRISRYNLKSMKLYLIESNQDSLIQMTQYDKSGNLTKSLSDGIFYIYTYDQNQNTIKMTDSIPKNIDGKEITDTFTFQYDANGLLKYAKFDSDQSFFTYDPRTATLVESRRDEDWPEPVISSYTYDPHKDITEMHYTDASDQSVIAEYLSYDDKNNVTKDFITRKYKADHIDTVTTTYTYNAQGKRNTEETYSSSFLDKNDKYSKTHTVRKDFYDGQSRLIEEFLFENGKEKERFIFTYDEYGYEPLTETYFKNGIQERVDNFSLDEHGLPATLTETIGDETTKYKYEFQRW